MIYFLRKKDGTVEATSSSTLVEKNGYSRHLTLTDLRVTIMEQWKSPNTKALYPAKWRIEIPSAQINVVVSPLVHDQELITAASTGITYWEGAVKGAGMSRGRSVSISGYTELTGYAGSLGGVF
jgi:predicted secreted hydrolase